MNKLYKKNLIVFLGIFIIYSFYFTTTNANSLDWNDAGKMWLFKQMTEKQDKQVETQTEYELSGHEKWQIWKHVNKILKQHQLWECLKDSMNKKTFDKIAAWDAETLEQNVKDECKDEDGALSNSLAQKIMQDCSSIKDYYEQRAKEKIRQMNSVASIWQYIDWNPNNSSFDLIKDIQEVQKKLFREEIEYEADETTQDELDEYLNDPFSYIENYNKNYPQKNNTIKTKINTDNKNNNLNTSIINPDSDSTWNTGEKIQNYINNSEDSNIYECNNNENSWLNNESLNFLINSDNWGTNYIFNYWDKWHIKMPDTNIIDWTWSWTIWTWSWEDNDNENTDNENTDNNCSSSQNDKTEWECNNIICIIVKIIMWEYKPLDYSEWQWWNPNAWKSIENILETSNYHLYKAANTNLAQHKTTTDNFETTFRHINFWDMLHMSIQISKQPVPNLNLEEEDNNKNENNNSCK